MSIFMDDTISPLPCHIVYLKPDPSKLKIKNLRVLQYGHLPGRTSKRKGAIYDEWSLTYIAKGTGSYQVDGGPVQKLGAGSLYWEWPGAVFHFGPDQEEGWDEYYVSFSGGRVQEWLDAGLIHPGKAAHVGTDPNWIIRIEALGRLIESGVAENADRAALLLEALIYEFYSHRTLKKSYLKSQDPDHIVRLLEDIENNVYKKWNERQFRERHHLSRSTLRRLVHQHTGYPLNEYVNRLKVLEAKKLLHYTPLQIKEISQMLGFEDPAYFSRLFKKFSGIPPLEFRYSKER